MNVLLLSAVVAVVLTSAASAQSSITSVPQTDYLIDDYVAFIGKRDLYNPTGKRLTMPWAIIRQDRVNFHRYGLRDGRFDQDDSFFASQTNRQAMEHMVNTGFIAWNAAQGIVKGDILIRVQVYGQGSVGHSVRVDLAH